MPERSSKKQSGDVNELAKAIIDEATSEDKTDQPEKNPAAVELGRLGGKKGGPARAKKLTKKRRKEIAKKAAKARWHRSSG
jgi:hypothetical protein